MKAITLNQHGSLNNVTYSDIQTPKPARDELLIEIKATALNRLDLWVVNGWPGLNLSFPHILGSDGAGIVAAVGSDIDNFAVGDRVAINPTRSCGKCDYCLSDRDNLCDDFAIFGEHIPGFFAQYQTVPERNLMTLPLEIEFEITAAASLVYVTAWHSLIEIGKFQPGEDILVIGAGGGVNTAYIDIARFWGAGTIYVVGSSNRKLKQAKLLGADVTINRHEQDWGKAVFKATNRKGVDVVVDNVGEATFRDSVRALAKGGRLLTVGNTSGSQISLDNRLIFSRHLHILGSTMGPRGAYTRVMGHIFNGDLRPVIDSILPLSNGMSALRRLEEGDMAGKIILKP